MAPYQQLLHPNTAWLQADYRVRRPAASAVLLFISMSQIQSPIRVLGIPAHSSLVVKWLDWFTPPLQPFPTESLSASLTEDLPERTVEPSPEHRDTFFLYSGSWRWLYEHEFKSLPRRAQLTLMSARSRATSPKPPVPWPSAADGESLPQLVTWIEKGCYPSRHEEVGDSTWELCARYLPQVRRMAGTFIERGSGPNCFGTVMAAAGVVGAEERWVQTDEFSSWLCSHTGSVRGRSRDEDPGTVLLWTERGVVAHAAITIGGGWALSKPSQSWSSPRLVWSVRDTILRWRLPRTKLSRHVLQ